MYFLIGQPDKPQTGDKNANNNIHNNLHTGVNNRVSDNQNSLEQASPVGSTVTGGDQTSEKGGGGTVTGTNSGTNLDKLAKAVARHETANCTLGSAKVNNCFGIMIKIGGKRKFKSYPTKEASYEDFKRIWGNPNGYYRGKFPTLALAKKYSGNDRAVHWLNNVTKFYNQ